MADPLSVLGAVAAASQLAGSVVKVIEIVRKLNREYKSPKITRQQLTQIEAVRSTPIYVPIDTRYGSFPRFGFQCFSTRLTS